MDLRMDKKHVYGAGEGDPSTDAVVGSQVGPTASSFHDHGRSGVDGQAPGCVYASGEDATQIMEVVKEVRELPRKPTRSARKTSERSESLFLASAMVADATSPMAGLLRTRMRSNDEESVASLPSRSSVASTASKGRKRKIMSTTVPEVCEELARQIRTSSAANVGAELTRHVSQLMLVATKSFNLKGTDIKALKDAASYVTSAWQNETLKKPGPTHSDIGTAQSVEARLSVLEKSNAALRKELAKMTACAHECPRCSGLTSEPERTARKGRSDSARLATLERRVEEIGPSIIRAIEERFRGRHHSPEAQRGKSHSATRCATQTTSLPKEQKNGE